MTYNDHMGKLEEYILGHGLTAMLEHIHAMVVVVEKDGTLVVWNHAFDICKSTFPPDCKLGDLFPAKETVHTRLTSKKQDHWTASLLIAANGPPILCDCMLLPLANNQSLFVAELINADPETLNKYQHLSRQVELFKVESETAKKIARRKQVEVDGIMAQAHEISQVDALTILPNRRMIIRELHDEVLRAERYNSPLSISVVDVDHFKKINDSHGHMAGDEVLRQVALQLREHIRHPDLAGRYGGEEFLLLLPNSDAKAAAEQAERLCKKVRENLVHINSHTLHVTISIGVAQFVNGTDTWETLLNRADTAMYEAKNNGRDQWAVSK